MNKWQRKARFFLLLLMLLVAFSLPSVVVAHGSHGNFEIRSALLLDLIGQRMDFEAVQSRYKLIGRFLWSVFGMYHEEHVWKTGAEVGSIRVMVT